MPKRTRRAQDPRGGLPPPTPVLGLGGEKYPGDFLRFVPQCVIDGAATKERAWKTYQKQWAVHLLLAAKKHSRHRGQEKPAITADWILDRFIEQDGFCYYLRAPLVIPEARRPQGLPWQPSLDRVDNSKGYTPENTRLVSWFWNRMRGTSSVDETLECLRLVRVLDAS